MSGVIDLTDPQQHSQALIDAITTLMANASEHTTVNQLTAPAFDFYAITPDDNADLPQLVRAIYIGQAGNVTLRNKAGEDVVFEGLLPGMFLPVAATRVMASTTAGGLVGFR